MEKRDVSGRLLEHFRKIGVEIHLEEGSATTALSVVVNQVLAASSS